MLRDDEQTGVRKRRGLKLFQKSPAATEQNHVKSHDSMIPVGIGTGYL
jgi:hypothetical protein